jgi:hypothetical protein
MAQIVFIFVILFLFIVSVVAKAVMDTLNFHYERSIFSKCKRKYWWDTNESWKNKYKNRDAKNGRAFIGSTTWLVWTTDAWHLFQSIMFTSLELMLALIIVFIIDCNYFMILPIIILIKALRGLVFELFWNYI